MDLLEKEVQDTLSVKPFKNGAHLRLSNPFAIPANIRPSLFAVSIQFGWAVVAVQSYDDPQSGPAFLLVRIETLSKSLEEADEHEITWFTSDNARAVIPISSFCNVASAVLTHLAFAASDRLILAATSDGAVSVFSLQTLISQAHVAPLRQLAAHSNIHLQALVPNPAPGGSFAGTLAVVYGDHTVRVLDLYESGKVYWTGQSVTAAEWSPMGKRLVVGYTSGKLEYLTHEGQPKGVIEPPAPFFISNG
ncbi:hypothetical protein CROQUDRAFT_667349 [Cronartium quercuum f. sp. fusiforme G11]|uniref:Nucleoporin Nup159/Nup146 N-terminal domain-containing protein n=1 Tax=Cronartium quercuum f. sp. fusiforme G11 TaxID=708437 RepID=A0A9P6THW2_9BASI|nr:hypothetical protein CROQUDRAFT_667349 [Cronartium quercuum f. sp. fusiforme G11]